MCRNITELRGLEPPATEQEIHAAAEQFVRKVTGVARPSGIVAAHCVQAADDIAAIVDALLVKMPARRQPPKSLPPLRRPEVLARIAKRDEIARTTARVSQ